MNATAAELLEAAAERIRRNGWEQFRYVPQPTEANLIDLDASPCCMVGAIRISAGLTLAEVDREWCDQPSNVREAEQIAADLVYIATGNQCHSDNDDMDYPETIASYNDSATCDADSAIGMLMDAAEMAR